MRQRWIIPSKIERSRGEIVILDNISIQSVMVGEMTIVWEG